MRIAVCDPEQEARAQLQEVLQRYQNRNNTNLDYVSELRRSDFSLRLEDGTVLYIPKLKFAGLYRHGQEFWQGHNMPQRDSPMQKI